MSRVISYKGSCSYVGPSIIYINTSHYSIIFTAASQPHISSTHWFWMRNAVSTYVATLMLSNSISHRFSTSDNSDPEEKYSSDNSKMFTVSLTPFGASMWKVMLRIRPYTTSKMCGTLYLSSLALRIHVISFAALAFYLVRGAIVFQILGCLYSLSILQIRKRKSCCILHISARNISFLGGGGACTCTSASCMM